MLSLLFITLLLLFFAIGFYIGTSRSFYKIYHSALFNKAQNEERTFIISFGKKKVITKILSIENGNEC